MRVHTNLVPRARVSFGQHQERGLLPSSVMRKREELWGRDWVHTNLVPRARARLGHRRPRVHGLWDNQQPEARFLASGLKANTADPRRGSLGIYRKGQKKRQPPPLPFANNCLSLGLP